MLCDIIKQLRIAHGISQVYLAKELGVTKQSVSNWENDNIQPSIELLTRIADYFDVSTDYLLCRSDSDTVSVAGLTAIETAHIKMLINDLKNKHTEI